MLTRFIAGARLLCQLRRPSVPSRAIARNGQHFNAIDGAHGQAQIAASASRFNHGVHHFVAAQNGVCGANFEAQRTTNAPSFINHGQRHWRLGAVFRVQWRDGLTRDVCQNDNARLTARWALVNGRLIVGDRLCIGLAIWVTASGALRLRQCIVNALRERTHLRRAVAFLATTAFLAEAAGAATALSCLLLAKMNSRTSG